jgi:ribose transport system permease protein
MQKRYSGRTARGHRFCAVGSNKQAALVAGVPVRLVRFTPSMLSGVFATGAGICLPRHPDSPFTDNIDESGRQMVFGATALVLMLFHGRNQAMRA